MKKINLLLVDDSGFIRSTFTRILKEIFLNNINIDIAKNGKEAVDKVLNGNYDVVLMDIEMPVLDGISAVKEIMSKKPLPIIMFSSLTQQGASQTVSSLRAGAIDFIYKPKGRVLVELARLRKELKEKINLAISKVNLGVNKNLKSEKVIDNKIEVKNKTKFKSKAIDLNKIKKNVYKLVVIGVSTGGPLALEKLFSKFDKDFPLPIVVVQHIPAKFVSYLVDQLNKVSKLNFKLAENGEKLKSGEVYFSPGNFHIAVSRDKIRLSDSKPVNGFKPSVDVLFESAALNYRDKVVGIILTGMGKDGLNGCKLLKKFNSIVIAQDKYTSVVWGMPRVVVENNLADFVLPLEEIYKVLNKLIRGR